MDFDGFASFVAYPMFAFLTAEQKVDADGDTPQNVLFTHYTDIKQPIITFGLPCVFDGTSIELSVANDDLDRTYANSVVIHLDDGTKGRIAQAEPSTNEEITEHSEAFGCFLFNGVCNFAINADTNHEQEIVIIDFSEINTAHLPTNQHVACT